MANQKNFISTTEDGRPLRILLFGSQVTTGGAQRVLLDQAAYFSAQGHSVRVVFYYDKDGAAESWRASYPFEIDVLSSYHAGKPVQNALALPRALLRFRANLRAFRPDVLETFTHDANLIGLIAAAGLGVSVRIATHHGQFARLKSLVKWLHRLVINSSLTSALAAVSDRARNQALAEGIRADKIFVIGNGVKPIKREDALRAETRSALGIGAEEKLVLTVGRLVPEKAQENLIDAVQRLSETMPMVRLAIAGEGPQRDFLSARIAAHGGASRCELLGNRSDVGALLNGADVFVLCSRTEGMPLALMEAMSLELPVIGTDLEGIRTLLEPDAGTIVPVDDVEALAAAIGSVLTNPDSARAMGDRAAARIAAEYSLAVSCGRYLELFRKFLG